MLLTLRLKFDAAHRLMHHRGKCSNLHGHTWRVEIVVEGLIDRKSGMIIDFADLKEVLGEVVDMYDHTVILNKKDPLLDFIMSGTFNYCPVDGEPTCEILVRKILHDAVKACAPLSKIIKVRAVRVWESDDASAALHWEK